MNAAGRVDSSASTPQRRPECPATTTAAAAASGQIAIQPGNIEETSSTIPQARSAAMPAQPARARSVRIRGGTPSSGRRAPVIRSRTGRERARREPAANSHIRAAVSK